MSAQPIHQYQPPTVPKTVAGIRACLPPAFRAQFNQELADAADAGTERFKQVKAEWRAQARRFVDPSIRDAFDSLDRGDAELFPSPFADHR